MTDQTTKRSVLISGGLRCVAVAIGLAAFVVPTAGQASSTDPHPIGTFGDWTAYTFTKDGEKVCYMASTPKSAKGDYTKRGGIFALITHQPADQTKDVFSYMTGYTYKAGSEVQVTFDNKRTFNLFTQDDTAWTPTPELDKELAAAVRRGNKMTVKGTSSRGTKTTDTFSLKGSTAAYEAISRECGV